MSERRGVLRAATLCLLIWAHPSPAETGLTCAVPPDYRSGEPALASLMDRALPVLGRFASLDDAFATVAPEVCLYAGPSEALGYFEPDLRRIAIDARLGADLQLAILLHEARHVEHFARGLCPDLSLSMQNYARAVWAMEADASTIALIVTWDMARMGDPGPFRALALHTSSADMAAVFAATITATGDVGEASAAAFAAWYDSERRRDGYYLSSCSAYLDEQDATHALPQYGQLDPAYFLSLCRLPNGGSFACAEPAPE